MFLPKRRHIDRTVKKNKDRLDDTSSGTVYYVIPFHPK
jgi:hypothetical protein